MKVDRSLRGARTTVLAVACVGVSAAGHVWMSGAAIPVWALVGALLAVGGAGYLMAGRQRGFAPIAGLMLVGELGLHLLFTAAQHAAWATGSAMSSMISMSSMPGMSRTSATASASASVPGLIMRHPVPAAAWLCGGGKTGPAGGSPLAAAAMPWLSAHGSARMVAVHVVAGLLCAGWLRRGEAATFRLLRALARFAPPLLALVWPAVPAVGDLTASTPHDADEQAPTRHRLLVHSMARRGPPTPVFFSARCSLSACARRRPRAAPPVPRRTPAPPVPPAPPASS